MRGVCEVSLLTINCTSDPAITSAIFSSVDESLDEAVGSPAAAAAVEQGAVCGWSDGEGAALAAAPVEPAAAADPSTATVLTAGHEDQTGTENTSEQDAQ